MSLNRTYIEIANVLNASDVGTHSYNFLNVNLDSRPANATVRIGTEYVYETEHQHKNNVNTILTEYQKQVASANKDTLPAVAGIFLTSLRNDYQKAEITQNTYREVVKQISNHKFCSAMIKDSANRAKQYKEILAEFPEIAAQMGELTLLESAMSSTEDPTSKLEFLLACGIDPNIANSKGKYAIHFPATLELTEMVSVLAQHKADLNVKTADRMGYTALHLAAIAKKPKAVEALIKAGAKIDILDTAGSQEAIVYALADLPTLKAFVENGDDVNKLRGPRKQTLLQTIKTYQDEVRKSKLTDAQYRRQFGRDKIVYPKEVMNYLEEKSKENKSSMRFSM